MTKYKFPLIVGILFNCILSISCNQPTSPQYDIVVYGATSGGIATAIQANPECNQPQFCR